MIYTPDTKKAMKLMIKYHKGQTDRAGLPYMLHPWHVAEQMLFSESTIVALLHDIIEDTECTIAILHKEGFSERVIEAVDILTHRKEDSYDEYINRISTNMLATEVKIEDLKHNMNLGRLKKVNDKDWERRRRYEKSLALLKEVYKTFDQTERELWKRIEGKYVRIEHYAPYGKMANIGDRILEISKEEYEGVLISFNYCVKEFSHAVMSHKDIPKDVKDALIELYKIRTTSPSLIRIRSYW